MGLSSLPVIQNDFLVLRALFVLSAICIIRDTVGKKKLSLEQIAASCIAKRNEFYLYVKFFIIRPFTDPFRSL